MGAWVCTMDEHHHHKGLQSCLYSPSEGSYPSVGLRSSSKSQIRTQPSSEQLANCQEIYHVKELICNMD